MAGHGKPTLQFLGAAKTVTGSKYLLSFNGRRVLVDCGLFQGLKDLRLKNWDSFPVDPKTIDAIILTHAHIDHSGFIPRLVAQGFRGPVYCTGGTLALARILLPDTGYLQEEEAEFLNRRRLSKHHPALPLFSQEDAEKALNQFVTRDLGVEFEPIPGLRCFFLYAGHILGAATLIVRFGSRSIGFTGDVGRPHDPVFFAPAALPHVDYLVMESTYGNRIHPEIDPMAELGEVIRATVQHDGVVLIPAFTVGRAQVILHFLAKLRRSGRIPDIPMFLNSPMARHVTQTLCEFPTLHKLTNRECDEMREAVRIVETVDESKSLNSRKGPMVIISASGMATGGRILHHLKAFAPDPKNAVVLTGFQAAGTRGEALERGVAEIKIHGQMVQVKARVYSLENLSAHADYKEMLDWLALGRLKPKKVFLTHGEPAATLAMKGHVEERFGWNCEIPELLSSSPLE